MNVVRAHWVRAFATFFTFAQNKTGLYTSIRGLRGEPSHKILSKFSNFLNNSNLVNNVIKFDVLGEHLWSRGIVS